MVKFNCIYIYFTYSIDATDEPSTDPVLGRLVNHGEKHEVNVKLKTLDVDGSPALCLFALRQIEPGEELLYDYGVDNLPWKTSAQVVQTVFFHFSLYT